ncbi:MAG TPA: DUF4337 family protein [Rhizomicrobium sp.]|jgi:hypothetical protein
MGHDPALDAHEHTEHAEHAAHANDPFISRIAISVAVLAVLAAVAGSLETVEGGRALSTTSEAVLAQDEATDSWNEFQADSIKKHLYTIAGQAGGAAAAGNRKNAKGYGDTQKELMQKAKDKEAERDGLLKESARHEDRHHWLTGSATLFEIGIAMSTVAIITKRHWLWLAATGFGAVGLVLLGAAYLG